MPGVSVQDPADFQDPSATTDQSLSPQSKAHQRLWYECMASFMLRFLRRMSQKPLQADESIKQQPQISRCRRNPKHINDYGTNADFIHVL